MVIDNRGAVARVETSVGTLRIRKNNRVIGPFEGLSAFATRTTLQMLRMASVARLVPDHDHGLSNFQKRSRA